jgi:hypothetical protein
MWPEAVCLGFELNSEYVLAARRTLGQRASVEQADFFGVDWSRVLSGDGPTLILGNPPWVTRSTLGSLGLGALPRLDRLDGIRGLDALTGKANFDVSEWMCLRLLLAMGPDTQLAMLLKRAVVHRLLPRLPALGLDAVLFDIDAKAHFGASVDAVLVHIRPGPGRNEWANHRRLDGPPEGSVGLWSGRLVPDVVGARETAHLAGVGGRWRSGVKHDCAAVFELDREGSHWRAAGQALSLEDDVVFPLLKGGDVFHGRPLTRGVVVTQRHPGQATDGLERDAPKLWAWLVANRQRLAARGSRIYHKAPEFAMFGIGPYSFAPYKVVISTMHKQLRFRLVPPEGGKPVLFDDTCLFRGFESLDEAQLAMNWLSREDVQRFLQARIFWGRKRPVTSGLLGGLGPP